jgi:hypothetical protein
VLIFCVQRQLADSDDEGNLATTSNKVVKSIDPEETDDDLFQGSAQVVVHADYLASVIFQTDGKWNKVCVCLIAACFDRIGYVPVSAMESPRTCCRA